MIIYSLLVVDLYFPATVLDPMEVMRWLASVWKELKNLTVCLFKYVNQYLEYLLTRKYSQIIIILKLIKK
jgi:hypothetical protein